MTFLILAGSTGLEPAASGVTGRRYNRLNYDPEWYCTFYDTIWYCGKKWWAKQGSNL